MRLDHGGMLQEHFPIPEKSEGQFAHDIRTTFLIHGKKIDGPKFDLGIGCQLCLLLHIFILILWRVGVNFVRASQHTSVLKEAKQREEDEWTERNKCWSSEDKQSEVICDE